MQNTALNTLKGGIQKSLKRSQKVLKSLKRGKLLFSYFSIYNSGISVLETMAS